jgi:hypothetical protein
MDVLTQIAPATTFYIAELYHQKYYLQCNRKLFGLLKYERREDFIDDPIATSINGYLHGSGTVGALMAEVDQWPLPFAAKLVLLQHVCGGQGLEKFKPIDESHVENPLPGHFAEHPGQGSLASIPTPNRNGSQLRRTFDEIQSDYTDVFPRNEAQC